MEIQAIEIDQVGKKMYLTSLTGKNILDLANKSRIKADVYSSDNVDGYQRESTKTRVKSVAKFLLSQKGVLPLSILLSVREEVEFKKKYGNIGMLQIPEKSVFWEVDGQHRLQGLLEAIRFKPEIEKFEVPIIIINPIIWGKEAGTNEAKYLEAYHFYIINKTQKGVRSDLVELFLGKLIKEEGSNLEEIAKLPQNIIRGYEWVTKAIQIAEILNTKPSVWQNKIRLPNEPKYQTTVNQKSFTDSLKPILMHANFKQYPANEIAEFLKRYWDAIREFAPEAFEFPKDYVIQKTTGPFVLHAVFPDIASYCQRKLTKETLKDILSAVKDELSESFWSNRGVAGTVGTNRKSFAMLEGRLRDKLVKSTKNLEVRKPFEL